MGKGNTPRFTRRVHKDTSGIKARYQKKQSPGNKENKEQERFNKKADKNQEIYNFSLIQYMLFLFRI